MNYFKLLELKISPPEDNEAVIKDAIIKKRKQWQKEIKLPSKEIEARKNIALISDIEDIMLNKEKRAKHHQLAIEERNEVKAILLEELKIVTIKGYIEDDDIESLYLKYDKEFSKEEIEKISPYGKKKKETLNFLSSKVISKLEDNFNKLNMNDISAYSYLGVKMSDSIQTCLQACDKKSSYLIDKAQKSHEDIFHANIISLCKEEIFNSAENRRLYNNYILGNKYIKLNSLIVSGVKANKFLNQNLFDALYEVSSQDYGMTKSEFKEYIHYNSLYNDYEVLLDVEEKKNEDAEDVYRVDIPQPQKMKRVDIPQPKANERLSEIDVLINEFSEYMQDKVAESNDIQKSVNKIQGERLQPGFHPSETHSIILLFMSVAFILFQIVFYIIHPVLDVFTLAIPVGVCLYEILKTSYYYSLWNDLKKSHEEILNLCRNINVLYERKLKKNIMRDIKKLDVNKTRSDLEKINSDLNIYMNNTSKAIDIYNKSNKRLKIPRYGFDLSKDFIFVLGVNAIYAGILLIYSSILQTQ